MLIYLLPVCVVNRFQVLGSECDFSHLRGWLGLAVVGWWVVGVVGDDSDYVFFL